MTADELRELLEQGEGQRLEFKASLSERDPALESLGAFRNADGGDVLIGVEDNGAPSGKVTIGANTLEELAAYIARWIDPAPFPQIEALEFEAKPIIRVSVEPRRAGFVYFVRGVAKARVGRINQAMNATEIRERHREGLEPPPLPEDWSREENAPAFHISPGVENGKGQAPNKLTMAISITGADVRPNYRWIGLGISDDWLSLTPDNPPSARKYSIRPPTPFSPPESSGLVGFEAVFSWRGAECHARWDFPFHLDPKNTWVNLVLDTTIEHLQRPKYWREDQNDKRAKNVAQFNTLIEQGDLLIQTILGQANVDLASETAWRVVADRLMSSASTPSLCTDFRMAYEPERRLSGQLVEEDWKRVKRIAAQVEVMRKARDNL